MRPEEPSPIEPPPVELAAAGPADAPELARLHGACFADGWDATAIAALIAPPSGLAFVVRAGGHPVGLILCRTTQDEGEVLSCGVAAPHRGRGFGTLLVKAAIAAAAGRGVRRLFLEVAEDNAAAQALYAGCGFATIARRRDYYRTAPDRRSDALVMSSTPLA